MTYTIDVMHYLQTARRLCSRCRNRAFPQINTSLQHLPLNCKDGLLPMSVNGSDCLYFHEGQFTYSKEKLI